jgi:hypothetical protein
VRDIGGELLVRVDPVVERRDHAAHGDRQAPDLVRAAGEVGDAHALGADPAHLPVAAKLGRGGKLGKRVGDGRGQDEAEPDRDEERDDEHLQHLLALGAQGHRQVARRLAQNQHGLRRIAGGHRGGDQHAQLVPLLNDPAGGGAVKRAG